MSCGAEEFLGLVNPSERHEGAPGLSNCQAGQLGHSQAVGSHQRLAGRDQAGNRDAQVARLQAQGAAAIWLTSIIKLTRFSVPLHLRHPYFNSFLFGPFVSSGQRERQKPKRKSKTLSAAGDRLRSWRLRTKKRRFTSGSRSGRISSL